MTETLIPKGDAVFSQSDSPMVLTPGLLPPNYTDHLGGFEIEDPEKAIYTLKQGRLRDILRTPWDMAITIPLSIRAYGKDMDVDIIKSEEETAVTFPGLEEEIDFSPKQLDLLITLLENAGHPVSNDEFRVTYRAGDDIADGTNDNDMRNDRVYVVGEINGAFGNMPVIKKRGRSSYELDAHVVLRKVEK